MIAVARLNLCIAATVVCSRENITDMSGSHRQKLYHKMFKPYVADAYNQSFGTVGRFVEDWVPQELEVSLVTVPASYSLSSVGTLSRSDR